MELTQFFERNPKAALAFSGGVDSAYLLYAAIRAGADVTAYCACTEFQPRFELEDAQALAASLGARLVCIRLSALEDEAIVSNPENRCYFCKRRIFSAILERANADGYELLLDGTNASDDLSHRPGSRALADLSVRSPLREAGLTKEEIRRLSREAGLPTWDKPAYACLATRIPTGEPITREALARTERAENYLFSLGLRDFRVRTRGNGALLQVRQNDLNLVLSRREDIVNTLKNDYASVTLDLEVRP